MERVRFEEEAQLREQRMDAQLQAYEERWSVQVGALQTEVARLRSTARSTSMLFPGEKANGSPGADSTAHRTAERDLLDEERLRKAGYVAACVASIAEMKTEEVLAISRGERTPPPTPVKNKDINGKQEMVPAASPARSTASRGRRRSRSEDKNELEAELVTAAVPSASRVLATLELLGPGPHDRPAGEGHPDTWFPMPRPASRDPALQAAPIRPGLRTAYRHATPPTTPSPRANAITSPSPPSTLLFSEGPSPSVASAAGRSHACNWNSGAGDRHLGPRSGQHREALASNPWNGHIVPRVMMEPVASCGSMSSTRLLSNSLLLGSNNSVKTSYAFPSPRVVDQDLNRPMRGRDLTTRLYPGTQPPSLVRTDSAPSSLQHHDALQAVHRAALTSQNLRMFAPSGFTMTSAA